MRQFIQSYDGNRFNSGVFQPSDYVCALALSAGVAQSMSVPNDAQMVIFSGTGDFWVRYNEDAEVPSASVMDGTASELNPTKRSLSGTTSISVIAEANCKVSLAFFGLT